MRWVQRDFFYLENLSFDGLGRDVLVVSPKLFSTLLLGLDLLEVLITKSTALYQIASTRTSMSEFGNCK